MLHHLCYQGCATSPMPMMSATMQRWSSIGFSLIKRSYLFINAITAAMSSQTLHGNTHTHTHHLLTPQICWICGFSLEPMENTQRELIHCGENCLAWSYVHPVTGDTLCEPRSWRTSWNSVNKMETQQKLMCTLYIYVIYHIDTHNHTDIICIHICIYDIIIYIRIHNKSIYDK